MCKSIIKTLLNNKNVFQKKNKDFKIIFYYNLVFDFNKFILEEDYYFNFLKKIFYVIELLENFSSSKIKIDNIKFKMEKIKKKRLFNLSVRLKSISTKTFNNIYKEIILLTTQAKVIARIKKLPFTIKVSKIKRKEKAYYLLFKNSHLLKSFNSGFWFDLEDSKIYLKIQTQNKLLLRYSYFQLIKLINYKKWKGINLNI